MKKRIAHFLSGSTAERLSIARKLVLSAAGVLLIGMPVVFGVLHASCSYAQAPAKTNPDDTWQGTLHVSQKDLRTVLKITKAPDGKLTASFYSIDQGSQAIPVKETTFQNGELKLNVEAIDGVYTGKMSPDGTTITGGWKQGDRPLPLILVRATADTAWAIPEPPPKLPPMAAEEIASRSPIAYATPTGQIEWRPQTSSERPLMTEDDAVKEFGLVKWAALSPRQKAQAKTVTKSDVDRVELEKVFGRTSTGKKAMELSSENPALYQMCKRKAKDEGLI